MWLAGSGAAACTGACVARRHGGGAGMAESTFFAPQKSPSGTPMSPVSHVRDPWAADSRPHDYRPTCACGPASPPRAPETEESHLTSPSLTPLPFPPGARLALVLACADPSKQCRPRSPRPRPPPSVKVDETVPSRRDREDAETRDTHIIYSTAHLLRRHLNTRVTYTLATRDTHVLKPSPRTHATLASGAHAQPRTTTWQRVTLHAHPSTIC